MNDNPNASPLVPLITVSFLAVVGSMLAIAWRTRNVPMNASARRRR